MSRKSLIKIICFFVAIWLMRTCMVMHDARIVAMREYRSKPHGSDVQCIANARAEIERRKLPYPVVENGEIVKLPVWVNNVLFEFPNQDWRSDDWGWGLIYDNETNWAKYINGVKYSEPGIKAYSRIDIPRMKEKYPEVLTTKPAQEATFLVTRVVCRPEFKKDPSLANISTAEFMRQSVEYRPASYKANELANIKLNEYADIISSNGKLLEAIYTPTDPSIRLPDDTPFVFSCNYSLLKSCDVSYSLRDGITVYYSYPVEQLADWQRIHNFITQSLEAAIQK